MKGGFPTPAMRLFMREACVLVPALVKELVWALRQIAPSQSWDGIDHLPKSSFRPLHLIRGAPESFLRTLAFDCDPRDVSSAFDERKIFFTGHPRLVRVKCEGAQDLFVFGQYRLGPRGAYSILNGKVAILLRPFWVCRDIRDDDPLFQECRSPA